MTRNWAITIGIGQYSNLQRLDYAVRDAEAMRDYFTEMGFDRVYHFSDHAPPIRPDHGTDLSAQPTIGHLRRFMRVFSENPQLQARDNLWFFFAGHGTLHDQRDYLLPSDADPGDIAEGGAMPLHYITERLRRSGAGNVVLLIDACRNQGRRDGVGVGTEKQQGVITFFACSPNEASYEVDELQHGIFTHVLLEGLRIHGEGNCATVERLDNYLRHHVPRLSQQYKQCPQTPSGQIEPPEKYHLILLPRQANQSDTQRLKYDACQLELKGDFQSAEQLWIRVLAVGLDQDAIDAIKRLDRKLSTQPPPPEPQPTSRQAADRRQPQDFVENLGKGKTLDMVFIRGGTFMMGSPDTEAERSSSEGPQHEVTMPDFFIGKYAITNAQWKAVMGTDPAAESGVKFRGDNQPVINVSWNDAVEFCQKLSQKPNRTYRLPSEAEWEYTCRAKSETKWCFGDDQSELKNYAWYNANSNSQTHPVGEKKPNTWGLYDMHGNVWEWCQDQWHDNHENYNNAPRDGSAWIIDNDFQPRLIRGGSWNFSLWSCRSASRNHDSSFNAYINVGFRVVCVLPRTS